MAVAVTINFVDSTQNQFLVYGKLTLSGNYTTHGDTVNLSTFDQIKSNSPANFMIASEDPAAGASASGFVMVLNPGTTLANNNLQVFENGGGTSPIAAGPLAELPAGAYPAGLTGAVIKFVAHIPSL